MIAKIIHRDELLVDSAGDELDVILGQRIKALMDNQTAEGQVGFLELQAGDDDQAQLGGILFSLAAKR